jgi:hypothetical protein
MRSSHLVLRSCEEGRTLENTKGLLSNKLLFHDPIYIRSQTQVMNELTRNSPTK